jgi:hypothetical protein
MSTESLPQTLSGQKADEDFTAPCGCQVRREGSGYTYRNPESLCRAGARIAARVMPPCNDGADFVQRRFNHHIQRQYPSPQELLSELPEVAKEFLKGGKHDGPCTNAPGGSSEGGPCWDHIDTRIQRQERLEAAIRKAEGGSK